MVRGRLRPKSGEKEGNSSRVWVWGVMGLGSDLEVGYMEEEVYRHIDEL